jgi:hypothetical protein
MEKEIAEMLAGVIERNTSAMEKMAKVTDEAGKASSRMASEVSGLRRIIAGAQQKIGGEIGAVIDRSKVTHEKMEAELRAIRESRKHG